MRLTPLAAAAAVLALPAHAGEAWDAIRAELYGERPVIEAAEGVTLTVPYRATDDREVPVSAEIALPGGRRIEAVTLVLDENPMPVSAVFDLAEPAETFSVLVNMRVNGPTGVRAVVEDDAGQLHMAEGFVKTSGLGACASPPVTDPAIAEATMGQMALGAPTLETSPIQRLAALGGEPTTITRVELQHPSLSGLQMDQITLLYVPANYVHTVEVSGDGRPFFTVTGSISLSENPEIEFSHPAGVSAIEVRAEDTDGNVFEHRLPLGAS